MRLYAVRAVLFAASLTLMVSIATLPHAVAAEAHIYHYHEALPPPGVCYAENDIYYDDITNLINLGRSNVECGAWVWFGGAYYIKNWYTRLDLYSAEAYIDAAFWYWWAWWITWNARAYAWTDPPNWGGYQYLY